MKKYRVNVNGTDYEITLEALKDGEDFAPKAEAPKAAEASKAAGDGEKIVAPMPGNILKVNVKNGDAVKAGDVLFVLEAMKMENEIQAEKDGTVTAIHVAKGDSVLEGAKIVTIA